MSKHRLKNHALTLEYLAKCKQRQANSIIKNAEPDLIHCLSDVCHNILKGNVALSDAARSNLGKYKSHIRKVANKKTTAKHKRTLIQKGGFLGALLKPLLGVVAGPLLKSILT